MDLCTNLPENLCSKPIDLTNVGSLNIICWDQFLRLTRLDDDTDWHDQFLARTYSEEEFMRKRKENVKKRSKSDTSTRHLPQQANFFPNKSASASPASEKSEKKFVRQNSASYRHSLPGIVENGVYTEQRAADRKGFTENFMEIDQTTNLDKKSVSMSDLRNVSQNTGSSNFFSKFTATTKSQENLSMQGKDGTRYRPDAPLKDGISQRVSNVKRMLRLNGLMHSE
ncbi:uncharacterized protein LOC134814483 [Bolinopsis microptera]|uniref:uncharacterized protein LOC134814483 n=1 Tax=Bolinopsis microptera TaxID=2820187 RepID=UPI00307B0D44